MKLNVLCVDKGSTIELVKVTNGLPLNLTKDQFVQEIEVSDTFSLKNDQVLYALITYTDNDIYVHSLYVTEEEVEKKYQQLTVASDKTFSIATVVFKKSL